MSSHGDSLRRAEIELIRGGLDYFGDAPEWADWKKKALATIARLEESIKPQQITKRPTPGVVEKRAVIGSLPNSRASVCYKPTLDGKEQGMVVYHTQAEAAKVAEKRANRELKKLQVRQHWIEGARLTYESDDIRIYEDAKVDTSPDNGTWVEAYVWVPKEESDATE